MFKKIDVLKKKFLSDEKKKYSHVVVFFIYQNDAWSGILMKKYLEKKNKAKTSKRSLSFLIEHSSNLAAAAA